MLKVGIIGLEDGFKFYSGPYKGFVMTPLLSEFPDNKECCYARLIEKIEHFHWNCAELHGKEALVCFFHLGEEIADGIAVSGKRTVGADHKYQVMEISKNVRELLQREYDHLSEDARKVVDVLLQDYEKNGCMYTHGLPFVQYDDGTIKEKEQAKSQEGLSLGDLFEDLFANQFNDKNPFAINFPQGQETTQNNGLYYIKNTVNECDSRIQGYFSTLDKAQEALKDCCDWYRSKGTGKIYRVDMDTLDPDPVLVCEDGLLIDHDSPSQKLDPDIEFYILMKAAYIQYADSYAVKTDISKGGPGEFALDIYALGTERYPGLLKFMRDHNIEPNDNEFNECFYNVKKEYESIKERLAQTFNLNALVVDDKGRRGRVVEFEPQNKTYHVLFIDPENVSADGWYPPERLKPYNTKDICVGSAIIDDDGYKGKVTAYNSQANMYKVEHELDNGRLPVADGWYSPERLQLAVENVKSSVQLSNAGGLDSLIAAAKAISDQSAELTNNLQKHKDSLDLEHE